VVSRVTAILLLLVCVGSPVAFAIVAWLSRASGKRTTAALVGGLVAALFSLAWDALAARMGWWSYANDDVLAVLAVALSVAFVFGAAAGLIGWRMMRAIGRTGVAAFFAGYVGLGMLRDNLLATNTTVLFGFGDGPLPQVMGAVGYLSLALAVQVTMLIMAGRPTRDSLRAS
jgi:hypothetical protein